MKLYLIRHGIAEPREPGRPDAERALTDKGRRRLDRVARGLERAGVTFDRVHHSPAVRTVQTAEALASVLGGQTVTCAELAEPPSARLLEAIEGERVALVGHEPWLSALIAWLVAGGSAPPAGGPYDLRKASVAILEGEPEPGGMVLEALVPPRLW